jgi:predicted glycosyltransferase
MRPGAAPDGDEPTSARILLYSHDSYGLGHFRRNLLLATSISRELPGASILCVTGSPRSHAFPLPPRFDYLKLPSATKDAAGTYRARTLPLSLQEIARFRTRILREAAASYRPDLVLVDHAPLGMAGEIVPMLEDLSRRRPRPSIVLGVRDIVDAPERVRGDWARPAVRRAFSSLYDRIFVYGMREVFDPIEAYGLPESVRRKSFFTGYLGPSPPPPSRERARRLLGLGKKPFVLGIVGGGGDGFPMLQALLEVLRGDPKPEYACALVTGPLMSQDRRQRLRARLNGNPHHKIHEFLPDLPTYIAAADVVVSMAGYNSVCEILRTGAPSILVPRVHPRLEQWVRAHRLEDLGLARVVDPASLTPQVLRREIQALLSAPPAAPPAADLDFEGAERAAAEVRRLLEERRRRRARR